MTVHLQLSALPLATRPLATAHPCHVRPTHQPSVSPGTQQRPTSPNSASGEHEKPLRGRLALSPGRWRIVRKCKSHRCTAVVRTAIQLCSRCGLAGTYCSNAVVLLWWWVGSWVGGGCLVGDGSLTIHEMAGGRKTTNLTRVSYLTTNESSILRNQPNAPRVPVYRRTYCCTTVLL